MPKFFVNQEQIVNNQIKIIGQDVNHIKNVLRLSVKDEMNICVIETHINYICAIQEVNKDWIICNIIKENNETVESNIHIHIFQGLPKADKLELIIEKCTEIGVKQITPVIMKRTIVKLNEKDKLKKQARWNKIAEVAAKQSGRDEILKVNSMINFKNLFEKWNEYDIVLIAYENEKENTLKSVLNNLKKEGKNLSIAVLIGPEGGIDEQEIQQIKEQNDNHKMVTLGKRILRTETAPLVISSNILYELEDE